MYYSMTGDLGHFMPEVLEHIHMGKWHLTV